MLHLKMSLKGHEECIIESKALHANIEVQNFVKDYDDILF